MTKVNLNLSYPELSRMIQAEANKQNINVKGYDIRLDKLVITSNNGRLRITGEIDSKWNAFFDFSAILKYNKAVQKLDLQDIKLDLDAENLIFKGILKLAKGNIRNRIESIVEKPLGEQLEAVKVAIDNGISNAPLPHNLMVKSQTRELNVINLIPNDTHLIIDLEVSQDFSVSFKENLA